VLSAVFLTVLLLPVPAVVELWVSDLGQLLAAAAAAVGCGLAATRSHGHRRRAWWWMAVGTGAWAAGQAAWSYYELVLGEEVPFPSVADIGFLSFTLAATAGLVVWLGSQGHQIVARGRDLLDGAIIAVALLLISWITTLGTVVADNTVSGTNLALSLAYPVGDLVLATLALLALARGAGSERATLVVLTMGIGGLALSDSAYVYLTSTGDYSSAHLVTGGWVVGFLLVAAAGLGVRRTPASDAHAPRRATEHVVLKPSLLQLCLPYLPVVAASVMLFVSMLDSRDDRGVHLLLGLVLVVLVLARQFLSILDTTRLMSELGVVRDQLEHQALHDALTGLANRVLFRDRLDRALLHPDANVSVLYCDLDDFKLVNDGLGHAAGDELLQLVAARLLECTRVTDTVARLGGDEFAILLEDADDALQVADRVVASLRTPVELHGRQVHTSISVGIAHHRDTAAAEHPEHRRETDVGSRPRVPAAEGVAADTRRQATAALLLRHADTAMYAAKGGGKGRAVLSEPGRPVLTLEEPA
jgi:diguanylate cyclase (GGDEF)-like protein